LSDPINEFIRKNYLQYTDQELANQLNTIHETGDDTRITDKAVKNRRHRMGLLKSNVVITSKSSMKEPIGEGLPDGFDDRVQQMLKDRGLDASEVALDKLRIADRTYTNESTGVETRTQTESLTISLSPSWESGPKWPVVHEAEPVKIVEATQPKKPKKTKLKTAIILPDPQVGFRRLEDGELNSFHDQRAIDVALQIVRDEDPELIVNLGDTLDFPQFGTYEQEPAFAMTTQATIDAGYEYLAQQRANAPSAHIAMLEGNHDRRLQKAIVKNIKDAFALRRAKLPEDWPVMSNDRSQTGCSSHIGIEAKVQPDPGGECSFSYVK
jgi:hypothetical protein